MSFLIFCKIQNTAVLTLVIIVVRIIQIRIHSTKSPSACKFFIFTFVYSDQSRKNCTTGSNRISPATLSIQIVIVYFPNRFFTPFACIFPHSSKIIMQTIQLRRYNRTHIRQDFSITAFIVLIHHNFCFQHLCDSFGNSSFHCNINRFGQAIFSQCIIQIFYNFRIHFIC